MMNMKIYPIQNFIYIVKICEYEFNVIKYNV